MDTSLLFNKSPYGFAYLRTANCGGNPYGITVCKFNTAFEKITGACAEGMTADEIFPESFDWIGLLSGSYTSAEVFFEKSGKWAQITACPDGDFLAVYTSDITHRVEREQRLKDDAEKYRQILGSASDGVAILDIHGKLIEFSGKVADQLGYTPEELKKITVYDWDKTITKEVYTGLINGLTDKTITLERTHTRKDGSEYHAQITATISHFKGEPIVYTAVRDITAQKINEKMLNDSHELLTKLSEQVPGTIYQYQLFADGSSCFPFASEHIRDIYEVTPEEIRHDASKVFSRLHSEDIDNVTETIIRSAESLEPWRCDYRVVLPQKGIRWLRGDANPEKMPDGSVLWHGYILDITDRKNAEDIIHRSEAKFRNVFENAAIGMSRTALNGRFIEVNRRLCEILGYTREELQNITFMDITHPEDLKADLDSTKQLLNGRIDSFSMEKRYITKSGQIIWVRLTSSYVRSPDENYFVSSVEDITDSKRIQLELEDSQEKLRIVNKNLSLMVEEEVNKRLSFEERYKRLFNNINEGLCVHGFDKDKVPTEFVEVNNRMCTMFGYTREELLRMKPAELHTPASLSDMRAKTGIIHKDGSLVFETELMHKNGGTIFCELNSSLMELDGELVVFTSIRDITETRRLKVDNLHKEHLLIQQSKLADMGSMIAAIAHQWKQPLNIIGLAAEVIGAEAENDSDVAEVITTINDQVRYMSETIDDFRNFFIPTKEKHSFSLMKAIQQILRMVQPRMITQNITVCLDGDESITAFGFQNEFMQVVMNIINNARDAIVKKSAKGGRITIGISSEACLTEVRIKDNGGGIPEDLLPDTIFKPYFTTKGNEGTGIGLSIAKTIIEKYMDGTIMAHNTQEGAEFVITLPAYENAVECVRSVKEKCLLYVEDDEFTLAKTSEMLRKHFACVYTAKNGIEGLIVFKRHQDEISAVLTDIDMPELNGIEMSKRLKAIAPDLPIIVLTAVSGEVFEDIGFKAVLDKPVSVRQLITLLHESIDEPTA